MSLAGVSVQTFSAVSAIALTAMSTIVASAALVFSFRQNVGWKPVILVTNSQLSGKGGDWRYKIKVDVEFWNRRKYPVVVRNLKTTVSGVDLINKWDSPSEKIGHVGNNIITSRPDSIVDPNGHGRFIIQAEFENQLLDALTPLYVVKLMFFDPYRNTEVTLAAEHKFFYPEMGWKKTPEQRAEIRAIGGPWLNNDSRPPGAQ